jgi:hypothetical protein
MSLISLDPLTLQVSFPSFLFPLLPSTSLFIFATHSWRFEKLEVWFSSLHGEILWILPCSIWQVQIEFYFFAPFSSPCMSVLKSQRLSLTQQTPWVQDEDDFRGGGTFRPGVLAWVRPGIKQTLPQLLTTLHTFTHPLIKSLIPKTVECLLVPNAELGTWDKDE